MSTARTLHKRLAGVIGLICSLLCGALLSGTLLSGCALGGGTVGTGFGSSFGGGTTGTGLTYGTPPGTAEVEGVSYFNLDGTILDEQGKPLEGIVVTIETSHQTDTSTTDAAGHFDVAAAAGADEEIRFYFHAAKLNAKFVYKNVFRNITAASFHFKRSGSRVVLVSKDIAVGSE